jgi:hypothetical protein
MANGEPNPTGTGRYCPPRVCYCGGCPWWTQAPAPDYERVRQAAEQFGRPTSGSSWDEREDPTWIDDL